MRDLPLHGICVFDNLLSQCIIGGILASGTVLNVLNIYCVLYIRNIHKMKMENKSSNTISFTTVFEDLVSTFIFYGEISEKETISVFIFN